MGRKSTVPAGWLSLASIARDHQGSHDTDLTAWIADLAAVRVERVGPDRTLAIREDDLGVWRSWYRWWRRRPVRPRRRKVRSDAGPAPRRRKWRPRP